MKLIGTTSWTSSLPIAISSLMCFAFYAGLSPSQSVQSIKVMMTDKFLAYYTWEPGIRIM